METGNIIKPVAAAAPSAPARADHLAAAGAVKTELAPEAAVQQAAEAQAVRFTSNHEIERRAALETALQDFIKRNITIDPRTREIVFQKIDERTGAVVRQLPEEAVLKLRAYARELREADSAADSASTRPVQKIV